MDEDQGLINNEGSPTEDIFTEVNRFIAESDQYLRPIHADILNEAEGSNFDVFKNGFMSKSGWMLNMGIPEGKEIRYHIARSVDVSNFNGSIFYQPLGNPVEALGSSQIIFSMVKIPALSSALGEVKFLEYSENQFEKLIKYSIFNEHSLKIRSTYTISEDFNGYITERYVLSGMESSDLVDSSRKELQKFIKEYNMILDHVRE